MVIEEKGEKKKKPLYGLIVVQYLMHAQKCAFIPSLLKAVYVYKTLILMYVIFCSIKKNDKYIQAPFRGKCFTICFLKNI